MRVDGLQDLVVYDAGDVEMFSGDAVTSCASLEAVVAHYASGGVDRPTRSPLMKQFQLTPQDITDLVAFMRSLSSPQATQSLPNLPAL